LYKGNRFENPTKSLRGLSDALQNPFSPFFQQLRAKPQTGLSYWIELILPLIRPASINDAAGIEELLFYRQRRVGRA